LFADDVCPDSACAVAFGFAWAVCFVAAAVEASYQRVSDRRYKSFVMWRGTFEAEFSDTSVGPVFFARGGMANQMRSSGREA
jgi:hypothetical protein